MNKLSNKSTSWSNNRTCCQNNSKVGQNSQQFGKKRKSCQTSLKIGQTVETSYQANQTVCQQVCQKLVKVAKESTSLSKSREKLSNKNRKN